MSSNRPSPNAAPIPGFDQRQVNGAVPSTGANIPNSAYQGQFDLGRALQDIGSGLTATTVSVANMMEQRVIARERIEASRVATEYQLGETMRATRFKGSYQGKPEDFYNSDVADQEKFYNDFVAKQGGVFSRQDTQQSALEAMNRVRSGIQIASFEEQYNRVKGATVAAFKEYGKTASVTMFHSPTEAVYTNAVTALDQLKEQMLQSGENAQNVQAYYESERQALEGSYVYGLAFRQGDDKAALELLDSGKLKYIDSPAMYNTVKNRVVAGVTQKVRSTFTDFYDGIDRTANLFFKTGDGRVIDQAQKILDDLREQTSYLTPEQQANYRKAEKQLSYIRGIRELIIGGLNKPLNEPLSSDDYALMEDKLNEYEAQLDEDQTTAGYEGRKAAVAQMRDFIERQKAGSIQDSDEAKRRFPNDPDAAKAYIEYNGYKYDGPLMDSQATGFANNLQTAIDTNDITQVTAAISGIMAAKQGNLADGTSLGHLSLMQVVRKVSGITPSQAHVMTMFQGSPNFNNIVAANLMGRGAYKDNLKDVDKINEFLEQGQIGELAKVAALSGDINAQTNLVQMAEALKTTFYAYKSRDPDRDNTAILSDLKIDMLGSNTIGKMGGQSILLAAGDTESEVNRAAKIHTKEAAKYIANSLPTGDILNTQLEKNLLDVPSGFETGMTFLGGNTPMPKATMNAQKYDPDASKGYRGRPHKGYDNPLAVNTKLYAPYDSRVVVSGSQGDKGWGNYAIIEGTVNGKTHRTLLAHLNEKPALNTVLRKGDYFGLSGETGNAQGGHLHSEMWVDGQRVDPEKYMYQGSKPTSLYGLPLGDPATQAALQTHGLIGKGLDKEHAKDVWNSILAGQGFGDTSAAEIRSLMMMTYSFGGSEAVKYVVNQLGPEMKNIRESASLTQEQIKDYGNDIRQILHRYGDNKKMRPEVDKRLAEHDKAMYGNAGFKVSQSPWTQRSIQAAKEGRIFYSYNVAKKAYIPLTVGINGKVNSVLGIRPMQQAEIKGILAGSTSFRDKAINQLNRPSALTPAGQLSRMRGVGSGGL